MNISMNSKADVRQKAVSELMRRGLPVLAALLCVGSVRAADAVLELDGTREPFVLTEETDGRLSVSELRDFGGSVLIRGASRLEFPSHNGDGHTDAGKLSARLVFDGGSHAMSYSRGSQEQWPFASGGSYREPNIRVTGGTELTLTYTDLSGWKGATATDAVIRVGSGAKLNLCAVKTENKTFTGFMRNVLYLDGADTPGSPTQLNVEDISGFFYPSGGSDRAHAQIRMETAGKPVYAEINGGEIGLSEGGTAVVTENGTHLTVSNAFKGKLPFAKYGEGTLTLTAFSADVGPMTASEGVTVLTPGAQWPGAVTVGRHGELCLTADNQVASVGGPGRLRLKVDGSMALTEAQLAAFRGTVLPECVGETAVLTLPAGAEGTRERPMALPEGLTLKLTLSELQMLSGYRARVETASVARVVLTDPDGKEVGAGGTYTPAGDVAYENVWENGAWSAGEPVEGQAVRIVLAPGSDACTLNVSPGMVQAAGSGTLTLSGTCADMTRLDIPEGAEVTVVGTNRLSVGVLHVVGSLTMDLGVPMFLKTALDGTGPLTWKSGRLIVEDRAILNSDASDENGTYRYTGEMVFGGAELCWGDGSEELLPGRPYRLAKSLKLLPGTKLSVRGNTFAARNADEAARLWFDATLILAGGKVELGGVFNRNAAACTFNNATYASARGGYGFSEWQVLSPEGMTDPHLVNTCGASGLYVRTLTGDGRVDVRNANENHSYGGYVALGRSRSFTGTFRFRRGGGSQCRATVELVGDMTLPKGYLAFWDEAERSNIRLYCTKNQQVAGLSGIGVGEADTGDCLISVIARNPRPEGAPDPAPYRGVLPRNFALVGYAAFAMNSRTVIPENARIGLNGPVELMLGGMNLRRPLSASEPMAKVVAVGNVDIDAPMGSFGGTFEIRPEVTVRLTGAQAEPLCAAAGAVVNNGILRYAGAAPDAVIGCGIAGSGRLCVDSGTLALRGALGCAGGTEVAAGAVLKPAPGPMSGALTLADGARLDVAGGAPRTNGNLNLPAEGQALLTAPEGLADGAVLFACANASEADLTHLRADTLPAGAELYAEGTDIRVRMPADVGPVPKPDAGDTTDYTPEASRKIVAANGGAVPETVLAPGLSAAQVSDALAVFDGILTASEDRKTVTVGYTFAVTDIRIESGAAVFTVSALSADGKPLSLVPGAAVRLLENGTALPGEYALSDRGTVEISTELKPSAPQIRAEAFREIAP